VTDQELYTLLGQLTSERLDIKDLQIELARREQEFLRKAAALQMLRGQQPMKVLQ
jgi:hypothetical protein